MSSNPEGELHLQSICLNEATEALCTFTTKESEHHYAAQLSETGGIRSVVIPEALEEFLRPFCSIQPGLVKKLVSETWRLAVENQPFTPLRLA